MHIRWRGLELPSVVVCEKSTLTPTYGQFYTEPFERGFGVGFVVLFFLVVGMEGVK